MRDDCFRPNSAASTDSGGSLQTVQTDPPRAASPRRTQRSPCATRQGHQGTASTGARDRPIIIPIATLRRTRGEPISRDQIAADRRIVGVECAIAVAGKESCDATIRTITRSPIWRSGCQGVGVDGHGVVVVSVMWLRLAGRSECPRGSRRWSCSYSGASLPQDLCSSHVRCLKSSAAACDGAGAQATDRGDRCARAGMLGPPRQPQRGLCVGLARGGEPPVGACELRWE